MCADLDKLFFQYLAPNCGRIKVMRFVEHDLTIDDSPVLLFVQFYDRYTMNKRNIVSKPFDPIQYELDEVITVNLSFSTPDRDRPVSVTKLWSQISHANRTLFTVPLILNKIPGLKLTINVSLIASEKI